MFAVVVELGVPESTPVPEFRDNHEGRPEAENVIGAAPAEVVIVRVHAVPTRAPVREAGLRLMTGHILIGQIFANVQPLKSCAVMVTFVPAPLEAVGVPLITPPEVMLRPAGNAPAVIE
jgi:hypothetical protein